MQSNPPTSAGPQTVERTIEFPSEGITLTANVTRIGPRLYRLDSVPLLTKSASFKDVIWADASSDGKLIFKRIAQRSGWRVFEFNMSAPFMAGEKLTRIKSRAQSLGAHWEQVFGGVLYICVPPNIDWNPTADMTG